MNVADIKSRARGIFDPNGSMDSEEVLYFDVLSAIAKGAENPRGLASAAIEACARPKTPEKEDRDTLVAGLTG